MTPYLLTTRGILILLSILFFQNVYAQTINRKIASNCVDGENTFTFSGNCSTRMWSISSGGTIISGQNTSTVKVKWTGPTSDAYVYVNYSNCSSIPDDIAYSDVYTIAYAVTPSVTLTSDKVDVCQGANTSITFTATPTNGGTAPYYTWFLDGNNIASGSSNTLTYNTSSLGAGGHNVYVTLTSSAPCPSPTSVNSSNQYFSVTERSSYTASISGPGVVCSGTSSISLYANVSDAVGNLSYEWFVNGSPSWGSNVFTTDATHGNEIYCKVYSDHWCVNSPVQTNTYTINVTNSVTPTVSVQIPKLDFCSGESITFTASSSYITSSSTYKWYLNGNLLSVPNTAQSISLTANSASVSGYYYPGSTVSVTVDGLSGTCLTSNSATGSTSAANVYPVPDASAYDQSICSGNSSSITITNPNGVSGTTFSWTASPSNVTGASNGTGALISQPLSCTNGVSNGTVTYTITPSANGCVGASTTTTVTVKPIPDASAFGQTICSGQMTSIIISNPNGVSGTTFTWTASPVNVTGSSSGSGNTIYQTLNATTSSNGTVTYTITPTANGCSGSPVSPVVTVNPGIGNPVVTHGSREEPGIVNLSSTIGSNGNDNRWYTASSGGTAFQTGTAYSPNLSATTTFYVSSYNTTTGCESARVAVTGTIYPKPVINATANAFVMGSTITLSTVNTYDTYSWMKDGVSFAASPTADVSEPGTYTVTVTKSTMTGSGTSEPKILDEALNGQSMTYVVSNHVLSEGVTTTSEVGLLPAGERQRTVTYLGGMGNSLQTIISQGSPLKKDIMVPVAYDLHGRQLEQYLPYISISNDSKYRPLALDNAGYTNSEQYQFYQQTGMKLATDMKPFSKTDVEPSPLQRALSFTGAGDAWHAGNKKVISEYLLNRLSENIRLWKVVSGLPVSSIAYPDYELHVSVLADENGNKTKTYVDKLGRTVLKAVQESATAWLQTVFVYDDLGRLAFTISPEGVAIGNLSPDEAFLDKWAFQYRYDALGRLVEYKAPAGGWIYTVYDELNRPALTQKADQRGREEWSFIKYDVYGRAVVTGYKVITGTSGTRANVQASVDAQTYNFELTENSVVGYTLNRTYPTVSSADLLSIVYYDNYNFLSYTGWDAESNNFAFVPELGNSGTFSQTTGLPTGSKVRVIGDTPTTRWLNAVQYYDSKYHPIQVLAENHKGSLDRTTVRYSFSGRVEETRITHSATGLITASNKLAYDHAGRIIKNFHTISEGSNKVKWIEKVGVDETGDELVKTAPSGAYDAGARTQNYLSQEDDGWFEVTIQNNYRVLFGLADSNIDANYTSIDYAIYMSPGWGLYVYENGVQKGSFGTYTAGDVMRVERSNRLVSYKKNGVTFYTSLVSSASQLFGDVSLFYTGDKITIPRMSKGIEYLLADYSYNELGQLVDKKLHDTGGNNFLQSVDYRYNIRGWLRSINNSQLSVNSDNDETNDFFGMEFLYHATETGLNDQTGDETYFNGSIGAIKWKGIGVGDGVEGQQSYKFLYDKAGRLKNATSQARGTTGWNVQAGAFNENLTYDRNGNIGTLLRKGIDAAGAIATIDNLGYTYDANKLTKVTDSGTTLGFNDQANNTTEYTYESGGSLTKDDNKGISGITYNMLGKPKQITFTNGRILKYTYTAGGTKLKMEELMNTTPVKTTEYIGGFVYENDTLRFFGSPEGRVIKNGSGFEYEYAIADHQGNTRVVFTSATPAPAAPLATFEGDSNDDAGEYLNVDPNFVVSFLGANHTPSGSKVVRMNNTYKVGPSKSLKVFPGDKVDMEVWEYHEGSSGFGTTSTASSVLINLVSAAFGGVSGASGESGAIYNGVDEAITAFGSGGNQGTNRPAAYLNFILFDKDYNVLDAGWQLVPDVTFTKQKVSFPTRDIEQQGYMFVYLSYDNDSENWVHFDDFKVTHTKTNVIQYNEYYPFGLQTANSWTRENASNNFLYNGGSELNSHSGWYETFFRGYDAALGRFLQVDPLAHVSARYSPYTYAFNDPVLFNDPNGDYPPAVEAQMLQYQEYLANGGGTNMISPYSHNTSHWADSYRSIEANAAIMSTNNFLNYYGVQTDADRFNLGLAAAAQSGMTGEETATLTNALGNYFGGSALMNGSDVVINPGIPNPNAIEGGWLVAPGSEAYVVSVAQQGYYLGNVDLGDGNVVNVYFANTQDGVNSNLPVNASLVNAFNGAVIAAGQYYTINSITISATTNGVHGPNSRHYAGNALDISMVNGIAVGPNQPIIEALQNAFENQAGRRENFGPALMMKLGQPYIHDGLSPTLYQQRVGIRNAHYNHIHWSVN
jgi:RHS repeat-associated protein